MRPEDSYGISTARKATLALLWTAGCCIGKAGLLAYFLGGAIIGLIPRR